MQLLASHLAAYLPYALRISYLRYDHIGPNFESGTMLSLTIGSTVTQSVSTGEIGSASNTWCIFDGDFTEMIKPLLRPLSDITSAITHNGETFVPAARFMGDMLLQQTWGQNGMGMTGMQSELGTWTLVHDGECVMPECTLDIYQKLLEWHFDVFGLIAHNLAIPIT